MSKCTWIFSVKFLSVHVTLFVPTIRWKPRTTCATFETQVSPASPSAGKLRTTGEMALSLAEIKRGAERKL